jgi:DNA repair exonuclease SbcCD ATPase subunit
MPADNKQRNHQNNYVHPSSSRIKEAISKTKEAMETIKVATATIKGVMAKIKEDINKTKENKIERGAKDTSKIMETMDSSKEATTPSKNNQTVVSHAVPVAVWPAHAAVLPA